MNVRGHTLGRKFSSVGTVKSILQLVTLLVRDGHEYGSRKVWGKNVVLEFGENTGCPGILLSEEQSSGKQNHGRAIFNGCF